MANTPSAGGAHILNPSEENILENLDRRIVFIQLIVDCRLLALAPALRPAKPGMQVLLIWRRDPPQSTF
jgi:hypothetical protein